MSKVQNRRIYWVLIFDRNGNGIAEERIKAISDESAKRRAMAIARQKRVLVGSYAITRDCQLVGHGDIITE